MATITTAIKLAVLSRLVLLIFQVIVSCLPDHQGSLEDTFIPGLRPPAHPLPVELLFGGLDNWDAEYFLLIADNGYTFEQTLAFFPLYPLLMRVVSVPLSPLFLVLPPCSVFLICGTAINLSAFTAATVLLYLLTMDLTHHNLLSLLSSALFCITPASVFMSAVYTESLFVCLSFAGMLCIQRSRTFAASVFFSLASATRSNGVVLAGFIIYHHTMTLLHRPNCRTVLYTIAKMSIQVVLIFLPFVLFQTYGYIKFCTSVSLDDVPTWCSLMVPISYSSLQSRYWGLGFLSYYQWKQLPNFLLCSPMVLMVGYSVWQYCVQWAGSVVNIASQLLQNKSGKGVRNTVALSDHQSLIFLPFIGHVSFLLIVGLTTMHVQVITRFIASSSPVIYWCGAQAILHSLTTAAHPISSLSLSQLSPLALIKMIGFPLLNTLWCRRGHTVAQLVLLYFISYTLLGYIAHCNYLPWT